MEIIIAVLVILSYLVGAKAILDNKYKPSIYSRIIWLLLAINSFASVVVLKSNLSVLLLAGLGLLGNLVILLLSLKKSKRSFGQTEFITSALLLVSLAIWIFTRLPLLNLTIGLIAHLVGGVPTYKNVLNNPKNEDLLFWLFFALASLLTFIGVNRTNISDYLYPLYFAFFDGLMVLLCLRRYILHKVT